MRQLWISVAILAGMVLLLSWNMVHVHQLTEPMREDLSQAVARRGRRTGRRQRH